MGIMLDLPRDLLVYIAEKFNLFEDFVALGGVCKAWRSAATKENFSCRPQIPWLMLAQREDSDVRGFYSLSKGMIRTVTLPEANEKRCRCLASEGWLITAESDWSMTLLHPLSRLQSRLPHISTLKDHDSMTYDLCIWKAVLSSSPSSSDCTIMIIQGCLLKLAFCKLGGIHQARSVMAGKDTNRVALGMSEEIVVEHGQDPLPPPSGKKGGRGQIKASQEMFLLPWMVGHVSWRKQ
ncbi:hypothetical protein RJ640_018879 [Escallonia rubra]|uniref:F-box domain-containing protein n=1 Tax=Escallonia rubra TaxID=112253 RepID=A0AA88RTV4_9ASTE|nr:hypothetical protein RJ640_018879 [Escallonia rubra]